MYYDIQISNINNNDTLPPVLNFIETRNNPFLYESDKYYMSIIRFSLDTPNLPVFIPTIQPSPNTDINLTIYS
ncbi:MAG: phage minor capsid protein, partial [bacterium]